MTTSRRTYEITKRVMDVMVSLCLVPIALPLLAACALAIWLEDGGPVLFVQLRTGRHGKRFGMYKLRSMVKDAEAQKSRFAHLNELSWPDFKSSRDPRVTRVGRFLRKTSLDELPQLLNVLQGDMSLVGPRPTSFDAGQYELWQTERLEVVPGITGLWQVNGRSDVDFDERVRLDIEYIRRRGLLYDLRLLLWTIPSVIHSRGAC